MRTAEYEYEDENGESHVLTIYYHIENSSSGGYDTEPSDTCVDIESVWENGKEIDISHDSELMSEIEQELLEDFDDEQWEYDED